MGTFMNFCRHQQKWAYQLSNSKYGALGVDVDKKGIEALRDMTNDLFPGSFCTVVRDPKDPKQGLILHEDGAGSKPIVSYLLYKEAGDPACFAPLAADVIAMNVDDVICVGGIPEVFSDYVALNALKVDKVPLLNSLAKGFAKSLLMLKRHGSQMLFGGGETADLPDVIRTLDVSGTVFARVTLEQAITGDRISPGDAIVGIRSGGKCSYEERPNSGMMCNGISLARHALLSNEHLKKYPEISDPGIKGYYGRFLVGDYVDDLGMTVGEAITSPTRIFLPIALEILRHADVKAMVHNTGGGLTKCIKLGKGTLYVKDSLPEPDPIFKLIMAESGESPRQMCRNFNMGVGMEVVVGNRDVEAVLNAADKFGVGAQVIGRCERRQGGNAVKLKTGYGEFEYL